MDSAIALSAVSRILDLMEFPEQMPGELPDRLSYRRAAELFASHTAAVPVGPFTLHQLRHSALTHAAEDGASTPMLMALSGHDSVRSLAKYTKISTEALGAWQAARDPAGRRRR